MTTTTAQDLRDIEDAAVTILLSAAPIDARRAQAVHTACQQFQTRDPLIHRVLTAHPAQRHNALNKMRQALAEADPIDGEMHTVAAVLTWTITGNSAVAQQLLAEGARRGTHTALNDLYTEAIALGLPHNAWMLATADSTLDTLRTGVA